MKSAYLPKPYLATLLVICWLLVPVGAAAQQAADNADASDDELEPIDVASEVLVRATNTAFDVSSEQANASLVGDAEGERDYEEIAELEQLEDKDLDAILVGHSDEWDSQLLAPFRGSVSSLHGDLGYVAELHQLSSSAPSGADMLDVPAVRKRFENTQVLGLTMHDDPRVRAYLDFFDGNGKPTLAKWISRKSRFAPLILKTLREEGLPEDLIYVAMIESGYSPWAKSPAGAVGLWQFISSTGRGMGLRIDAYVDERRDPVKATRAAARYLTYLHDKFGSWPLALAGYNGGPGLVAKTIKKYNSNNYWFICRQKGMYSETRRYVPKVIAAALATKNADLFDLDVLEEQAELTFDVVEVPPKTRLSLVANAVGTDVDTLEELNPELRRAHVPPGKDKYALRIPSGTTDKFVENFDKIQVRDGAEHITYRARFGESVRMIGERMEVPPRVIRAANGLEQGELPRLGAELIIPEKSLGTWKPRKKSTSKKVVLLPSGKFDHPSLTRYFYKVNGGDTIESIGRGLGIKPSDLVIWNDLDADAHLKEGLYLQIFLPADREVDSVALEAEAEVNPIVIGSNKYRAWKRKRARGSSAGKHWHRVRSGESLWLIARDHNVTVAKIKRWNPRIRRNPTLQPGQKVLIYRGR